MSVEVVFISAYVIPPAIPIIASAITSITGVVAGLSAVKTITTAISNVSHYLDKELLKSSEYFPDNGLFVTKMNNYKILTDSLKKLNLKKFNCLQENYIEVIGENFLVVFKRDNDSEAYSANFDGNVDLYFSQKFLDNLHEEYINEVQQTVYFELVERAKNKNIKIESEEVLQDNSILLTFDVNNMF